MLRWHLIPRNRFFNIYLHHFLHDDDDRALHDHPWWSVSFLLKGQLEEMLFDDEYRVIDSWWPIFRTAKHAHRLILCSEDAWTLFITGPKSRAWGFYCPHGWRHWTKFVDMTNTGKVGKGCD